MGKNGKINIPMMLACVLLCLTLISMHLTGGLYARYVSTATGSDSARVAKFAVSGALTGNVTVDCAPDSNGTYTLTVKNDSEVAVSYDLSIRFGEAWSNKWTVSLKDGEAPKEGTRSADSKTINYGTLGSLAPGDQYTYTLEFAVSDWSFVTVDATDPTTETFSKDLTFHVDIHAEQID